MDPTVTAAAVTGGLGIAGMAVTHVLNRRHSRATVAKLVAERDQAHAQADAAQAQAAVSISAAATAMLTPLTEQVTRLAAQVATLTAENRTLREKVGQLEDRLAVHERNEERLLAAQRGSPT